MAPRPVAFDMFHGDAFVDGKDVADFEAAYAAGYRAVMHKASQGRFDTDPLYAARRERALAAGFLWGAYHYMDVGDVGTQISALLTAAPKGGDTIYKAPTSPADERKFVRLALDFEDNRLGLNSAEHFLDIIHRTVGQAPWLYSGFLVRELLEKRGTGAELAPYQLWLAEYSTIPRVPRIWKHWVLWQRSGDGQGPGPHDIPGIGSKVDVDYFDGSDDDLKAAWYGDSTA